MKLKDSVSLPYRSSFISHEEMKISSVCYCLILENATVCENMTNIREKLLLYKFSHWFEYSEIQRNGSFVPFSNYLSSLHPFPINSCAIFTKAWLLFVLRSTRCSVLFHLTERVCN